MACPDARYRDGKRAAQAATRACDLSHWTDFERLSTLAATCAEAGDFPKAVEWEVKARTQSTDAETMAQRNERLESFRQK